MTPKEVLELAKKHDVKFLDLKFIDTIGPLDEARIVSLTIPAVISGRGAY